MPTNDLPIPSAPRVRSYEFYEVRKGFNSLEGGVDNDIWYRGAEDFCIRKMNEVAAKFPDESWYLTRVQVITAMKPGKEVK